MIRGALVFGTGLALGYAKAVSETEAVNKTVNDIVEKVKKAWDEADKPTSDAPESMDDVRRQLGIEFLMKRLNDALPYATNVPDDEVLIRDAGEVKLTMGDLRAPFKIADTDEAKDEPVKITYNIMAQGETEK